MKIIISPAKKMNADPDAFPASGLPCFLPETRQLLVWLRGLSYEELKKLLGCSDQLAQLNYRRYQEMELERGLIPALFAYEGIQYQHMAPTVFTDAEYAYVQKHLRILSGFYGMLRPFDGIVPYRLEMQAKPEFCGTLYRFWGQRLGTALSEQNDLVIDLASEEYSRAARQGLGENVRWVTVYFGQLTGGKFREKGTLCKKARGTMVRYMAQHQITDVEALKEFDGLGFQFWPEASDDQRLYFLLP